MEKLKRHWPLVVAVCGLWVVVAGVAAVALSVTRGHLVYALDDPYIHMAMAKNFARHGVWGVTRYGFSSSSSAPLWTFLLAAAYFTFGVNGVVPFILNLVFASLAVYTLSYLLRKQGAPAGLTAIAAAAAVLCTPLPALIFVGQEHVLHALLTLLFLSGAAAAVAGDGAFRRATWPMWAAAPLLVVTRYEGLFLVAAAAAFLALRRRPVAAAALAAVALAPPALYGWMSVRHGWYFLPNPVLLKGNWPVFANAGFALRSLGWGGYEQLCKTPHVLFLVLGAAAAFYFRFRREGKFWNPGGTLCLLFVTAALLHLQFADAGWFYRYEAYLVFAGIYVLAAAWPRDWLARAAAAPRGRRWLGATLLVVLVAPPFVYRAVSSLILTPLASKNIYEQQYQVGLFLRDYYPGAAVVAQDVGAINYLADVRCLDAWGLADVDVFRAIRGDRYDTRYLSELARRAGVRVAVGYKRGWEALGGVPAGWSDVGAWKINHNVVCGNDVVIFYAASPGEVLPLRAKLKSFGRQLPADVVQMGAYTRDPAP